MNVIAYNKKTWDALVDGKDRWTRPVSPATIQRARKGEWKVLLTPKKTVPRSWFPPLRGRRVLCLAGAGGQQGPVFAAAGARVTVFDNSPKQLAQDRFVAEREGLKIRTVQGDMRSLKAFKGSSFDFIFHPVSNCFAPTVRPVWREAFRVLKRGGTMINGMSKPIGYLFDYKLSEKGIFKLRYKMPYSDLIFSQRQRDKMFGRAEPINFAHSMDDLVGGQLDAGFHLTGFFEDDWGGKMPIDAFYKSFFATRALKP